MAREAEAASAFSLASAGRLLGCREDWCGEERKKEGGRRRRERRVSKGGSEVWGGEQGGERKVGVGVIGGETVRHS